MGPEKALQALARGLQLRRKHILQAWEQALRLDPELTAHSGLPRRALDDRIPWILDTFERRLSAEHPFEATCVEMEQRHGAAEHGTHRWQQGYQLRETIREWGHLQLVVLRELERCAVEQNLSAESTRTARELLARLCSEGVGESASRYVQLQQAEAASRLGDLQESLEALQALETERAQLVRETTHDLRGGVGVLANAATLLAQPDLDSSARSHFADVLRSRIQWMSALLSELAELARLEAGEDPATIQTFDAAECVRACCEALRPLAAEKGLFLRTEGPRFLEVEGDPVKVARIAQNLLQNAIRATSSGGVDIRWDRRGPHQWVMQVRDTGPGIEARAAAPLLEVLKHASREAHATEKVESAPETGMQARTELAPQKGAPASTGEGIGLSIVKRLCEVLGAGVELETAGSGTTFEIVFPTQYRKGIRT